MIVDVVMPKMGESITEGTILEWKKKMGETVDLDETILEISTEKVNSDLPSPAAGKIIEVLFNENDVVEVGAVLARIGTEGESASDILDVDVEETKLPEPDENNMPDPPVEHAVADPVTVNLKNKSDSFYSPLVRSIAKVEGISTAELDSITGSGKDGRVNKQDVLTFINNRVSSTTPTGISLPHIPSTGESLSNRVEPMGRVRQKIAQHMLASQKTSPHVYSTAEVDVTNMVNYRAQNKDAFLDKNGIKLTYTPLILDACVKAIQEYPLMNASIDGDNIKHHQNINLGVAVALPDNNLIVPVIKSSEERNMLGLARATADLAKRARKDKLEPDEIFGSTFTVTNPGIFGSLFGMAIINQPNVGILSLGSIQKRPVVKETEFGDMIAIRSMMYLTLGYDHRLIDGAYGTRFLSRITAIIESWDGSEIKL